MSLLSRPLLASIIVALAALFVGAQPAALPVMVYGIAFEQRCGSDSARQYRTRMSDSRNYNQARQDLMAAMQADFPGLKIISGSSRFDYGDGAKAFAIAQWQRKSGSCSIAMVTIKFGRDPSDARNKLQIPRDVANPTIETRYFPTIQSAR